MLPWKPQQKSPYITDLHVHSSYAYATSKYLNLTTLYQWAQIKGIDVVGTGDFTHPAWFATLQEQLAPVGNGFYRLKKPPTNTGMPGIKPMDKPVYFCLSTEISCVYHAKGKVRKSHHLVYMPDFAAVACFNKRLASLGNLAEDGRPTLNISARHLLGIVLETSPRAHLIPAHIWTPWYAILGAKAGYDSLEDCFGDLTKYIFALETGLSSDPAMNWHISKLDRYAMVSNSDAHSAKNLGREATLFTTRLGYDDLFEALHTKKGFSGTLEFFPEEGKYYLDGHRACKLCLSPEETLKYKRICPRCQKPLTLGVRHRVNALSDREKAVHPPLAPDFSYIVPLPEIIAQIVEKGPYTQKAMHVFKHIINLFGNEFTFLRHTPISSIEQALGAPYAIAIDRLRSQQVVRMPGYDGCYGKIMLWEKKDTPQQTKLFP